MKVFVVLLSLCSVALASLEPSSYVSPGSLSPQYLPPRHEEDQQEHYEPQKTHSSARPSSQFLPPQYEQQAATVTRPATEYQVPHDKDPAIFAPSSNYLPALKKSPTDLPPPSSNYLPPQARQQLPSDTPINNYLSPKTTPELPSEKYLPTFKSTTTRSVYLPPAEKFASPKNTYIPPVTASAPHNNYVPPSTPAPRIPSINLSSYNIAAPAHLKQEQQQQSQSTYSNAGWSAPTKSMSYSQSNYPTVAASPNADAYAYTADSDGYNYGDAHAEEQWSEPAKYEFEYQVNDWYGNDFGHKESREGDLTRGSYSVLLPDGRKQTVQYEVDKHGYKPKISYEKTASVLSAKTPNYEKSSNDLDSQGPY